MADKRRHSDLQRGTTELPLKTKPLHKSVRAASKSGQIQEPSRSTEPSGKDHDRLNNAEETLRAIRSGEVDAVMVSSRTGDKVVTLRGGEPSYRMLVEAMSEGAATLTRNGEILYCNRRFAEFLGNTTAKVAGNVVQSIVEASEQGRFETLLEDARKSIVKGEFNLRRTDGSLIPVCLSLSQLRGYKGQAFGMVITDLSDQKRRQAAEIKRAATMHRLLLERTLVAQEEERRRIARELHDEAGQLLTALLVGLRTLEDIRKLADVKTQGKRLREIASQTLDEVGRLARGLHPSVLDDHGLGIALSRYLVEYEKTHVIAVSLTLNDLDASALSFHLQIALYRILQEALTNVARHAGATTVSICFARTAAALEIVVVDNGCGFDAEAISISSQRLGIHGMRERAVLLGGTIQFAPQSKGTRLTIHIPLAYPKSKSGSKRGSN